MDRHQLALRMSARWLVPPVLLLGGLVVIAIAVVLLGAPSVDDVGSWRWTVVRPA